MVLTFQAPIREVQTLSLNQKILIKKSLFGNASVTHVQSDFGGDVSTVDFNGSYTLFNAWNNTIGLRMSQQDNGESKNGFYFMAKFPAWKFGDMQIRADQNLYRQDNFADGDFDETIVQIFLTKHW